MKTEMGFITKDSGKRKTYKSGMNRDITKGKLRFDLIPIWALERLAGLYTRGAEKYGDSNWMKADSPEEIVHFKASLWRHYINYLEDVDDGEDHFAAILWNTIALEYLRNKI